MPLPVHVMTEYFLQNVCSYLYHLEVSGILRQPDKWSEAEWLNASSIHSVTV